MSSEFSTERDSTPSTPYLRARVWILILLFLLALRLPSLTHPAGGDQSLYLYSGQRVLAGDTPYLDVWDQKPPGIMFVYAALQAVWPDESVVAAADLLAAALTAGLLVVLGRRFCTEEVGFIAAAAFLLLGDPALQRLGGLNVRGQCETFIVPAVVLSLVLATTPGRRAWHLLLAGVSLELACWLKYNAAAYALPLVVAVLAQRATSTDSPGLKTRPPGVELALVGAGAVIVGLLGLGHFAARGALDDLWRATVSYNLQYSGETYGGPLGALAYLVTMPVERARVDVLWFLGLAGAAVAALRWRGGATAIVLAWIAAVVISIAVNGARGLPQYFIQAPPALALAFAVGVAVVWTSRPMRIAAFVLIAIGFWRVGSEPTPVWRPRLGGLPSVASNLKTDIAALTGRMDARAHLARFTREDGKFPTVPISDLAGRIRSTTKPEDPVLVFGFAGGGVLNRSDRVSASRFFWSRPVVVDFARGVPGYGPEGLLEDLRQRPPAVVVLQKHDWRLREPNVPNSIEYFMANAPLRQWLESGYRLEDDTADFAVWRRQS
jgi:hypothetical protein